MSRLSFQKEINTLLVDDESIANPRLSKMLAGYPFVKIIGTAENGTEAVALINTLKPDLVFLDIRMPGIDGFTVLEQLACKPMIVFVTAYDEYAIKAFEVNSVDYLLKPVDEQRLEITLQRIIEKEPREIDTLTQIKHLLALSQVPEKISTIPVKIGNKINLVRIADVCFFEAKDKYVYIHTPTAALLIDYSLSYLQDRLPSEFLRVHRSFIINKLHIREIHKYFKGTFLIQMNDLENTKIKTAYSYSETIRTKLLLP
jgi:two-component system LytT family response regulator